MSTLWTPDGEHRVPKDEPRRAAAASAPAVDEPGGEGLDPEQAAAAYAQLEQELLAVPAADVIANHCYGLFELAALHLSRQPPNFTEARLAIDALGGVVEALGERLGEREATLREGLSQIRLAFVQLSTATGGAAQADASPDEGEPGS